ncbi:hypothetical protein ACIRRA_36890 [Nocardia sp. NPDC101769]|uniref:hypothetical protein n=1 Tax=Nocardia sp. NPDC101769 TaxID=3364333 RepID=UPI0037FC5DBA
MVTTSAVYAASTRWWAGGQVTAIHTELRGACRRAAGREPDPTAAVINQQSIRAAETVSSATRDFGAEKKVAGCKTPRHRRLFGPAGRTDGHVRLRATNACTPPREIREEAITRLFPSPVVNAGVSEG